MARAPQVRVEERMEPGAGYRSEAEQAVLELTRPPLEPPLELPLRRGVVALAISLVLVGLPMLWVALDPANDGGGMHPAMYGALGGLALTVGLAALAIHVRARYDARRRRRARSRGHAAQALQVRVDRDGLHATPRRDERWDGELRSEEVADVFADRDGPYHRVRVELGDGRQLTLLDGVEDGDEAERLAARVRARLARGLPSRP